jgi:hypothetical protein
MISSSVNAGTLIAVVLISSVVAVTTLTTLVASASAGSVISSAAAAAKIFLVLPSSATSWEIITFKILVAVLDEGSIAEFKLSSGDVVQFCTDGVIMPFYPGLPAAMLFELPLPGCGQGVHTWDGVWDKEAGRAFDDKFRGRVWDKDYQHRVQNH